MVVYRDKNKYMKNKRLIIGILIALVVIAGILWYGYLTAFGPKLKELSVSQPDIVAIGDRLAKIEVFGKSESGSNISMGPMELVESSNGEQTWILEIPAKPLDVKEIFARGYTARGRKTNEVSLAIYGKENLKNELWAEESQVVLSGIVKSISGRTITLSTVTPTLSTITVKVDLQAKVFDAQGKVSLLSRVRQGGKVSVTGKYTEETTFTASQVELNQ